MLTNAYQVMMHNNFEKEVDCRFYLEHIYDEMIIDKYMGKLFSSHEKRLLVIKKILSSNIKIKENISALKYFFNMLSPLNIEYMMGSKNWSYKELDGYLFVQNTMLKNNDCLLFDELYLDKIEKVLNQSGIVYSMHKMKSRRNYKTLEVIFLITIL